MSESVGTVQLDVQFNQDSVSKGINNISNSINNSIRNSLNKQNNVIKSSMSSAMNSFRNMGNEGVKSTTKTTAAVNKLSKEFTKTQSKIDDTKGKLNELDNSMDNIAARYADFPAMSGMTKDESMNSMLKNNEEYQKLSESASKLEKELETLVSTNQNLSSEMNKTGHVTQKNSSIFSNFRKNLRKSSEDSNKAARSTKNFGNEMQSAGNKSKGLANAISRSFNTILKRIFIYQVIMKGIRGIMSHTSDALMTNNQFVTSLRQIQSALATAFMPIYNAVLPALNALMSAVATVTTYIAAAISSLFGGTLQKSFGQAKKMKSTVAGMKDTGKAAGGAGKKAKKAGKDAKKGGEDAKAGLMGFDEINQIDLDKGSDSSAGDTGGGGGGGGAGGLEMPAGLAEIDTSGIDKFKDIMGKIFEPFKLAWENEGQNTVDAVKYALGEIKLLMKEIGKSWLEVWTNGTGQAILENILRILQVIFGIIGDIAKATRLAWTENDLGTKMLQAIANAILSILGLIEEVGISWRSAWNDGSGKRIMTDILNIIKNMGTRISLIADSLTLAWTEADRGVNIFTNINRVIKVVTEIIDEMVESLVIGWGKYGNDVARTFVKIMESTSGVLATVAEALNNVWDNGGQRVFEGLLELGAEIFNLAGYIYTEFVAPFLSWFIDLIEPAISVVMDAIGFLLEKFTDLISWLQGDGKPVLDTIITVFGSLALAVGIVSTAIKLKNGVLSACAKTFKVVTGVTKGFGDAMKFLKSPIGIAILAIGAAIAIGITLYKNWDEIKEGIIKIWNKIKEVTEKVWNGIKEFFSNIWSKIKGIFSRGNKDVKENTDKEQEKTSENTRETWNKLSEWLGETWNNIKESASQKWENIKTAIDDKVDNAKESISTKWNNIKTGLEGTWDNIKTSAGTKWENIKVAIDDKVDNAKVSVSKKWDDIKTNTSTKWDGIKNNIASKKGAIKEAMLSGFKAADLSINGILKNAKSWGQNLMTMFSDGIRSKIESVKSAATSAANAVKDKLGFASPTEDGPGADSDKWAPNFMDMFSKGIEDNIYKVSASVNATAGSVKSGVQQINTDDISSAVGSAIIASQQTGNNQSSNDIGDREIIVELDGTKLGRVLLPKLDQESERLGYESILQIT